MAAKFTRGHFKRIAAMLNAIKPIEFKALGGSTLGGKLFHQGRTKQWNITVDWFAAEFSLLNPNFDVDKFKGACGL